MVEIMSSDDSWSVGVLHGQPGHPMVLDVSSKYICLYSVFLSFNQTSMCSLKLLTTPEEHPIVFWEEERDRQRVYESDLTANYLLLRDYLVKFGHNSPLPDLRHHQAHHPNLQKTVQQQ